MRKNNDGAGRSTLRRALIGAALGFITASAAAAVLSLLVSRGTLGENMMRDGAYIAAFLGALIGATSARVGGGNRFASAGAAAGMMVIIRFTVAAFGGGRMFSDAALMTAAAMLLGGLTAALPVKRRSRVRRAKRR